jgi:hypothetical protein
MNDKYSRYRTAGFGKVDLTPNTEIQERKVGRRELNDGKRSALEVDDLPDMYLPERNINCGSRPT